MLYGLKGETIEEILGVLAKYPRIAEAVLYGSRAKGTYRNGSDIDLTLKGTALTSADARRVASDLDDSFLPYSFDVSVFDKISNPDLVEHINRVGIVFYERSKGD